MFFAVINVGLYVYDGIHFCEIVSFYGETKLFTPKHMRGTRKFCQEGQTLTFFYFLVDEGR